MNFDGRANGCVTQLVSFFEQWVHGIIEWRGMLNKGDLILQSIRSNIITEGNELNEGGGEQGKQIFVSFVIFCLQSDGSAEPKTRMARNLDRSKQI